MTEKTNLFPSLIRFRETNRLKMAIAASIMLWCATPQQAAADTYEKHEIASVQQQKVKTTGTVVDQNGEAMIGVSVKVKDNATMGAITDLEGKFSIDTPKALHSKSPTLVIKPLQSKQKVQLSTLRCKRMPKYWMKL